MSSHVVPSTNGLAIEPQAAPSPGSDGGATEKAQPDHEVNAAGTHPRGVLRWGTFILYNAIGGVVAVSMFVAILYADGIDPYMRGTYDWLLAHPGVTSFIAFSPLAASLLVGWGYSQRARKRKAAAAAAAAKEEAQAKSAALPSAAA
jgi:hypothetical protein